MITEFCKNCGKPKSYIGKNKLVSICKCKVTNEKCYRCEKIYYQNGNEKEINGCSFCNTKPICFYCWLKHNCKEKVEWYKKYF